MNHEKPKKALITGILGQDGSYLAEFLLSKGYEVHGLIRWESLFTTQRIEHIMNPEEWHTPGSKLFLHYGDITDTGNLERLIKEIKPDEVYHLAAMSHVKVSFEMPEYTANTDALGTLRLLEAIKNSGVSTKFYMACSSEMFGKAPTPQNEKTVFHPRSPYAVAKTFSFYITRMYREAYNMFAVNGVLYNHECVSENTPVIIRDKHTQLISIKRIKDIIRPREKGKDIQQWPLQGIEIWDGENFVDLKLITATRRRQKEDNFHCKIVNTPHGVVEATNHHTFILADGSKVKARDIEIRHKLLHKQFPEPKEISSLSKDEALFMGMMAGDGYISEDGKGKFSSNDKELQSLIEELWRKVALGTTSSKDYMTEYGKATQTNLNGNREYLELLRKEMYTSDNFKKVPDRILNAHTEIMLAFLNGYNITNGLKYNKSTYDFKNFKTDSALLAQGLLFLIHHTTRQDFNITFEVDERHYGYYSINLLSPVKNAIKEEKVRELLMTGVGQRGISGDMGISRPFIRQIQQGGTASLIHHFSEEKEEVKKHLYHPIQPRWVFDVEAASGVFMAGVGNIIIANSPRRGETFVTRKITYGIAKIKAGKEKKLYLGNLEAKRDWGFAPEYCAVMHKMLQQEKPDDFVIATGESHSVREFLEGAFEYSGLGEWQKYVEIDPRYFRPAEVEELVGDSRKAKEKLGWEPKITFQDLIKIMVDADLRKMGLEAIGEGDKILKEKFPNRWWKVD